MSTETPREWTHKSEWSKRARDYMVIVSRHDVPVSDGFYGMGPHRWAVCAYIYPAHRMFSDFDPLGAMWQDATRRLPLHGGASLFRTHRADQQDPEKITAFQVGADYGHLHDEVFTHAGDDAFPSEVEHDAQALFNALADAEVVDSENAA